MSLNPICLYDPYITPVNPLWEVSIVSEEYTFLGVCHNVRKLPIYGLRSAAYAWRFRF